MSIKELEVKFSRNEWDLCNSIKEQHGFYEVYSDDKWEPGVLACGGG